MSRAEDKLPPLLFDRSGDYYYDGPPVVMCSARVGDLLITDSDFLTDFDGTKTYTLLPAISGPVDPILYPELYAIRTTIETIADEVGSPFPYKYVADLAGV